MHFALSVEQSLLQDSVRNYLSDQYSFERRQGWLRSQQGLRRAQWKAFAEMGWLGIAMPAGVGGMEASAVEIAIVAEQFGRFLVLEPFTCCAILAAHVLDRCQPTPQQTDLLRSLINGEALFALAHNELPARGQVSFVEARAERRGDRHVLNGQKCAVFGGYSADHLLVSARTSGAPADCDGLSLFLVDPSCVGVSRRGYRTLDGSEAADIELLEVEVGMENLLGPSGKAYHLLEQATEQASIAACAEAIGIMDSVINITAEYLKTRRAYGTTLSSYQALQHRLADMLIELELSRSILHRALSFAEQTNGSARSKAVCAAKTLIGRASKFIGASGIQLHGAIGVTEDYIIGHYFKRLTVLAALFGAPDFHLRQYAATSAAQ